MIDKPDCAWNLTDMDKVNSNGLKVMTTFSCGGGSSMGYKRAGCEVIAANDIDKEMAHHYKLNHNPKHYFLCPISELTKRDDLPDELFNLDILDGSPPCSTFSTAGSREKSWGKDKHFREGQAKQVLSDLFFDYLDLAEKLKPKVVIAENVKGMITGNAKGYVKLVMARLKAIGYRPQLFLINAADCGVPQKRERVFFVAIRDDMPGGKLILKPKHRWISAGEACRDVQVLTDGEILDTRPHIRIRKYFNRVKKGESFRKEMMKDTGKDGFNNNYRLDDKQPSFTLPSMMHNLSHWDTPRTLTYREASRLGSFPDDYKAKTDSIGKYMIGMSVPPKMAEAVARAVIEQWLN